jgi:ATP-binding cassette subfamily B protein
VGGADDRRVRPAAEEADVTPWRAEEKGSRAAAPRVIEPRGVPTFHAHALRPTEPPATLRARLRELRSVFRQVPGTFGLVWQSDRGGALALAALTAVAAVLPAGIAWVGKLIVDAVVAASRSGADPGHVTALVLLELALMATSMATTRLLGLQRELLRARLGNVVNERILEKALELELRHFEDADVYDKMQNARREASARPLSLVMQAFAIGQNAVTLAALSVLLVRLSAWRVGASTTSSGS